MMDTRKKTQRATEMTANITDAYQMGYEEFEFDCTMINPFLKKSELWFSFLKGWNQARYENS